jgi:hypothetical protein
MILLKLKDYEVAREMFGTNTKEQCKLVKNLREKGTLEDLDEDYCIGYLPSHLEKGEVGYLIPKSVL